MKGAGEGAVTGLVCLICGRRVEDGNVQTCPSCGAEGILDVQYDYDRASRTLTRASLACRPADHWRYSELLPLASWLERPPLHVGWTPVSESPRLAREVGTARLFLKDDGRNPTASLKDRASAIGVMKALQFGAKTVACASTGNAASSLAGLAASVGLRSVIFIPERAPGPKVTQLLVFGAAVVKVMGTYEQAFELCRLSCGEFGWYNRNSGTNPFLVEGKKTAGLEIAEQCAAPVPDWVVVSVGDGCTIGGIGKGLREMHRLGLLERLPRLLGVQAEGAAPIVKAFETGGDLTPVAAATVADSIAVGTPRNWRRALAEVGRSAGCMMAVSDAEIMDAMKMTARLGGIFGEPAGVAGVAGLKKAVARGVVERSATVLVVITGNGLKDIEGARTRAGEPIAVAPDFPSLERALRERGIPLP